MSWIDPTALFLSAALSAGIIEGSSVIRHHRRGNDAAGPSVPALAVRSIVYGVASVPLGVVGASPGLGFLPPSISSVEAAGESAEELLEDDAAIKGVDEEDRHKSEPVDMHHVQVNDTPPPPSNVSSGIGRGMGRMLRHENAMKMKQRQLSERPAASPVANSAEMIRSRSKTKIAASSPPRRFIATLDGAPLPTPLAEAMRRSRCILIGAGLVSYVMARQPSRRDENDTGSWNYHQHPHLNLDYDQFNIKGVSWWSERIKTGKSVQGTEALKQLQINFISGREDEDTAGSNIRDMCSRIPIDGDAIQKRAKEALLDCIYDAAKWINAQLGIEPDRPPYSLVKAWKAGEEEHEPIVIDQELAEPIEKASVGDEKVTRVPQEVKGESQKSSSNVVVNAAVTSVDVLGTSIRHLLVSTYRVASTVATLGRKGKGGSGDKDSE